MPKSLKYFKSPQMEVAGFIAAAALSIPVIILVAYGISSLITSIF